MPRVAVLTLSGQMVATDSTRNCLGRLVSDAEPNGLVILNSNAIADILLLQCSVRLIESASPTAECLVRF